MMRALPAVLLATIAFALPALAADDPILSRLAGQWSGRGTYQAGADAAPERVICKITNTLVQNGRALQQSGRCSISSGSSGVSGLITAAGGGRYTGTITSMASDGPASFTGTGSGGRLTLNMSFTDGQTHAPAKATSTMAISGSGYHLTTTRRDGGKNWTSNDITFKLQ
jgi:hypothetical protein